MSVERKQHLLDSCMEYVEERINRIEVAIKDLEDALKLETKCSMGDKYETGRAMLHLEFEKLSVQHVQVRKLKQTLSMIDPKVPMKVGGFGSAIKTPEMNYFIAIPTGELILEDEKFYAVGASAPISRAFNGKKAGDEVVFNDRRLLITEIF